MQHSFPGAGASTGDLVGVPVGLGVGLGVGALVGLGVGAGVGLGVGARVGSGLRISILARKRSTAPVIEVNKEKPGRKLFDEAD